ncbi:anti-sigma B factor RsbW [Paenibacillus sp. SC116]|uniref:anti-sigma B factor RsbW n=1 Tax=Paenibacillus sp. SC116 TaxID=2968986 RepID=UPI00215A613C|nr:anti-sigma B factor RsbW [Paenibacillus sp. SC116]MCR8846308.1 anti-sigma B factor RsbW [Paenibacillus sp. SC116]
MAEVKTKQQVNLCLPAQADYVDVVRLTLYGIASRIGFSYEEIEDMKVAVSEACNNAVLYAYSQEGGMVDIIFEIGDHELELTIRDQGSSFMADNKLDHATGWHDKSLDDVQAGGLGFYLMQALMDDVSIVSHEGRGTEVKMMKRVQAFGESR